ncbi:MAG TPA: AAA family ATPase, partial [Mycobacteriales bacterium]|nr:AAA family ATPase [Mycobacteriales bacterium]
MTNCRTYAVANQKGGVAKTTTVASVAAALAELGKKVLVVDLDPQACLTFSLGLDPDNLELSVHDVLLGRVSPRMALQATAEGPDLLPSTIDLAGCEAQLLMRTGREYVLRQA